MIPIVITLLQRWAGAARGRTDRAGLERSTTLLRSTSASLGSFKAEEVPEAKKTVEVTVSLGGDQTRKSLPHQSGVQAEELVGGWSSSWRTYCRGR